MVAAIARSSRSQLSAVVALAQFSGRSNHSKVCGYVIICSFTEYDDELVLIVWAFAESGFGFMLYYGRPWLYNASR